MPQSTQPLGSFVLDDGYCGRNLQIGSMQNSQGVKIGCSVSNPTLVLKANGGAAKYRITFDGQDIGEFAGDGWGWCCVQCPTVQDGVHSISGVEEQPKAGTPCIPFQFIVDTVPPPTPSVPAMSGYSDSPPPGDNVTMYRNVNFHGTGTPGNSVQLKTGVTLRGGALIDSNGNWSVTTSSLPDGDYDIYAIEIDSAGNKSPSSATFHFKIQQPGTVTPTKPGAVSNPVSTRSAILNWSAPSADGGAAITNYNIYKGSDANSANLLGSVASTVLTFTDQHSMPADLYWVAAVNSAGEGVRTPI